MKDLNVSQETIKILEESIGNKISYVSCSNMLIYLLGQGKRKKKLNKWDDIKLNII